MNDYDIKDVAEWDGTDAAHPAWWRGEEAGVRGACMRVEEALRGNAVGVCREPLQAVRDKLGKVASLILEVERVAMTRPHDGSQLDADLEGLLLMVRAIKT